MTTALAQIVRLLVELDTVEIHELQTIHLPHARQQALASQERTTPVRFRASEPTVAVEPDVIRREYGRAEVAAHAEGEVD